MPAEIREMDWRMSYIRHGKVLKSGGQHSVIPEYGIWSLLVSTYEIAKMSSTWQLCKVIPFKLPVVGFYTLDTVSQFDMDKKNSVLVCMRGHQCKARKSPR